jgi:hypothetical protein
MGRPFICRRWPGRPCGRRGTVHSQSEPSSGRYIGKSHILPEPHGETPAVQLTFVHR